MDPYLFSADPDPAVFLHADPDPDPAFAQHFSSFFPSIFPSWIHIHYLGGKINADPDPGGK